MSQTAEVEKKIYELSTLFELSKLLNSSLDLNFITDNLLLVIMGRMMITRSLVLFNGFNEEESSVYKVYRSKGLSQKNFDSIQLNIMHFPDEIKYADSIDSADLKNFVQENKLSLICPIIGNERNIGFAIFGPKFDGSDFAEDDINFLQSVVNIASTAIENARAFTEIKNLNEELDKRLFRLNTLFDISKQFNTAFEEAEIAKLLGFVLMGQLLVNRYFIYFYQEQTWNLLNSKGVNREELQELFTKYHPDKLSIITNTKQNTNFKSFNENLKIETIYPIIFQGKIKCVIGVGASLRPEQLEKNDEEFLSTLANYTINALENAFMFRQEVSRKRLEEEMQMARKIQQDLLPAELPDIANYDIHALNIPSLQVGGDLYDVITLEDGCFLLAIADVTGKGTPAALLMSNIQAALRTIASADMDLSEAAKKINNIICNNTSPDKFITGFIGILDPVKNIFKFVNAGHNPPYLFRKKNNKLELLEEGGLLFGIMPDVEYENDTVQLEAGDSIFMFTDGVSEALNSEGEEFSEQLIEKIIIEYKDYSSVEFVEKLLKRVESFRGATPQSDDITIINLKNIS